MPGWMRRLGGAKNQHNRRKLPDRRVGERRKGNPLELTRIDGNSGKATGTTFWSHANKLEPDRRSGVDRRSGKNRRKK